ncbi:hypothetical protein HHX47_DHR3000113 [Lentinula edodes]|nr:hypothetical protein HHX47_DHR3000113 [Lentinula edodes]
MAPPVLEESPLDPRPKNEKADEYNKAGTLTAIPATTKSIGEGAYLSPRLGEFPGNPDHFKRFKLLLYANKRGYELGKTLLFSRHFVLQDNLQMLIPPVFLVKSPSDPSRPAGENRLGLRIHCTPLGGLGENMPAADWHSWNIHDWPASITKA